MNPRQFLIGLGMIIAIQCIVNLVLLYGIDSMRPHSAFIMVIIVVMALFCISLYAAARIVVRSSLTRLYIQLVMIAVFIKLALCLAMVIVYKQVFNPVDNSFIWSFLFIYITSTIYEVIFLEKVGRQKNNKTT